MEGVRTPPWLRLAALAAVGACTAPAPGPPPDPSALPFDPTPSPATMAFHPSQCPGYDGSARSRRLHCGACGNACSDGLECRDRFDLNGVLTWRCEPCPSGGAWCPAAGACVDVSTNPTHCGACGNACAAGEGCSAGRCVRCPAGASLCGATCADLQSDQGHCGACGRPCSDHGRCVQGVCARNEPAALPPPELRAPLTGFVTTSRRPWFRWTPRGTRGPSRVEVCATRDCARVEATWVMTMPAMRPSVPLAVGVHFWRVVPRDGAPVGDEPVGEFAVPGEGLVAGEPFRDVEGDGRLDPASGATPRATTDPMGDFNGDGYIDFINLWTGQQAYHQWDLFVGGPERERYTPVYLIGDSGVDAPPWHSEAMRIVGDRDGDGLADVTCSMHGTDDRPNPGGYRYVLISRLYTVFGGSPARFYSVDTPGPEAALAAPVARADLNADGATDLVTFERRGGGAGAVLVSLGLPSPAAATQELPWRECPFASGTSERAAVADVDDDGYDDVVVEGRVALRGGPWITEGRCAPATTP